MSFEFIAEMMNLMWIEDHMYLDVDVRLSGAYIWFHHEQCSAMRTLAMRSHVFPMITMLKSEIAVITMMFCMYVRMLDVSSTYLKILPVVCT